MKGVWISWEQHRRTRELVRALRIPLFELTCGSRGWRRYARGLVDTTRCLLRERPTHLFVQCPSVVLAAWAALWKPWLRFVLVVDLHNEAVAPYIHRSR